MEAKKSEGKIPAKQWIFERKQRQSFRIEMCKGKLSMECTIYSKEPITRDNSLHDALAILKHCLVNSESLDSVVFLEDGIEKDKQ